MSSPPVIARRVTAEMKTLLRALADREQITESALVRQLLEAMLRRSAMEGFPKLEALEKVSRDARLTIRSAALIARPGNAPLPVPGLPQPQAVAPDLPGVATQLIKLWR